MKAKALLCIPIGHRWRLADEIHETRLTMRCTRCGRLRTVATEPSEPSALSMRRGFRRHVGRF